jgi:hypothetical protein
MYLVMTECDGPVCATYTKATAHLAVTALGVLGYAGRLWPAPTTPQTIAAQDLEVLCDATDVSISEAFRVTVVGDRVEVVRRKTLRGLLRLRGCADGEGGASAEAPTQAQAERLARAALAAGAQREPFRLEDLLGSGAGPA